MPVASNAKRSLYPRLLAGFAAACLFAALAWSQGQVSLQLGISDLEHEAATAEGLSVVLVNHGDRQDLTIRIERIELAGLDKPIRDAVFECAGSQRPWPAFDCRGAQLEMADSPWGPQSVTVDLDWHSAADWRLTFSGLRYAGGRLQGDASGKGETWKLQARASGMALRRVQAIVQLAQAQQVGDLAGDLSLEITAQGTLAGLRAISGSGRFSGVAYADSAGEQAAEKLAGRFKLRATTPGSQAWSGAGELSVEQGQLYSDPVFLDFGKQAWTLGARGGLSGERFAIERLKLDAGRLLQAQGEGVFDASRSRLESGELRLTSTRLEQLFPELVQPLLRKTAAADLEVRGGATLSLTLSEGQPQSLDVSLDGVELKQGADGFALDGISGGIAWRGSGTSPDSRLAFESGRLGRLRFGGAELHFNLFDRFAWLVRPLVLPFYGGDIRVGELSWVATEEGPDVGFGIAIQQASLGDLSADLGWPRMQGQVSGRMPRARYSQGDLLVDGGLGVEVFDGTLTLQNVRLGELDSVAPVLEADMELRRLDLYQLTQTFSFGEIQGRLDGDVSKLRLVAWQPDRFDAHLYSTPDDDRRHRISQRAVDNLTELGNGVSGALSASFLRFFEQFSYDRIELKVRQRGSRAWIDGIPASDGGYYLVKGAGLPRIDVIGRNREVGWTDLLSRLKSIRLQDVSMQ